MNNRLDWIGELFSAVTAIVLGVFIMALGFGFSAYLVGIFVGVAVNAFRFVTGG